CDLWRLGGGDRSHVVDAADREHYPGRRRVQCGVLLFRDLAGGSRKKDRGSPPTQPDRCPHRRYTTNWGERRLGNRRCGREIMTVVNLWWSATRVIAPMKPPAASRFAGTSLKLWNSKTAGTHRARCISASAPAMETSTSFAMTKAWTFGHSMPFAPRAAKAF